MAIENITEVVFQDLITKVSSLTTFIQAVGGLILAYILFNIINAIAGRKSRKKLEEINDNLEEIKKILKKNN